MSPGDLATIKLDATRVLKGHTDRLKICDTHNKRGILDSEDCKSCPLWYGRMNGGCCMSLRIFANHMGNRKQKARRLKTLSDFLLRRVYELTHSEKR